MKIGALASSLRKPLPATLKKFQEMGLCGVQLLTSPEYLVFSDARLKEIRTMCADHGLEISAVCGDIAHTHFGAPRNLVRRNATSAPMPIGNTRQ